MKKKVTLQARLVKLGFYLRPPAMKVFLATHISIGCVQDPALPSLKACQDKVVTSVKVI